jgi:O-antigen/teichoic acid export membrane protein
VYSFLLLIGINNGLGRELPYYLGKGDEVFANKLLATALYCVTAASGIVLLGGICCALVFSSAGSHVVLAIVAITMVTIISFYQHVLVCTFRSRASFQKLTIIQFTEAGLSLATIPIVYYFHFGGMVLRMPLIAAILIVLMYRFRPMSVRMRFEREPLKRLLKTGVPIFGLDYVRSTSSTLDKVVLLKTGGVKDVGMYSLAGVALTTLSALSDSLASYMYPRMTYRYGQTGNPRSLWNFGIKFVLIGVLFASLGAIAGAVVLPRFVPLVVPKYLGGLRAAQIILLSGVFEACTIIVNALWSMKVWRLMMAYQLGSALLFAAGPVLGVMFVSKSLEGVAWGVVMGSVVRCILAMGLTFYATREVKAPLPADLS